MLECGAFCLDLGHIAWIWAIWQNLGQNRPQRGQSPEDGVGGMYGCMDGQTDSPCVLQDFVPFGAAAQKDIGETKLIHDDFTKQNQSMAKVFNKTD